MNTQRPNTLQEWYPDALAFCRTRYRYLDDLLLDEVLSRFAVRAVQRWHRFDPARGRAFTYLCMAVRAAKADLDVRRRTSKDLMTTEQGPCRYYTVDIGQLTGKRDDYDLYED